MNSWYCFIFAIPKRSLVSSNLCAEATKHAYLCHTTVLAQAATKTRQGRASPPVGRRKLLVLWGSVQFLGDALNLFNQVPIHAAEASKTWRVTGKRDPRHENTQSLTGLGARNLLSLGIKSSS